ncbi:viral A-type inclusion protein [Pseudostreptobacillus hongkongensis]|uniref:viral A-type inclusion protein n=1 Tax=Pseudostreptobacillus hongkongensis TaxID=1162717 RepID=UPI0028D397AD|nr:viral A-type inclusion protein [Pseudostreptobacillus hongkongensis]
MKNRVVNPNNITDMDMINAKNQASMVSILQRIGKAKRKKELTLSKNSQKYLLQMIGEMKKQMKVYQNQLPNLFSFFNYVEKSLQIGKKEKWPKEKKLLVSFDEQDLLVRQMKDVVKGLEVEKSKLKWYNFAKKMMFSTMQKQTEALLEDLK